MTYKRYVISELPPISVLDMDTGDTFPIADGSGFVEAIVGCLNELHEENQSLKSSNLEYEDALARLEEKLQRERASFTKQHLQWRKAAKEQIQALKEENKQLKPDNKTQFIVKSCEKWRNYK